MISLSLKIEVFIGDQKILVCERLRNRKIEIKGTCPWKR